MENIIEKTRLLAQTSQALGQAGLLIIESSKDYRTLSKTARQELERLGYRACPDYVQVLDNLDHGTPKIFYIETKERLNSSILEIVAEFPAGLISLADKINNTGLKTASFNPAQTSFIIVINRGQVELSHPRLFDYVTLTQTV